MVLTQATLVLLSRSEEVAEAVVTEATVEYESSNCERGSGGNDSGSGSSSSSGGGGFGGGGGGGGESCATAAEGVEYGGSHRRGHWKSWRTQRW